jgi:hypothetical protein
LEEWSAGVGFAMTKFKEKVGAVLNDTGAATASSASETMTLASPPVGDREGVVSDNGEASSITTTTALPATAAPSASETVTLASPPAVDQQDIASDFREASSITTTIALPVTAAPSANETVILVLPPADDQQDIANGIGEASFTATTISLADTSFAHGHHDRPGADAAITDIQHHNATSNVGAVAIMDSTFEFGGHLPDHDVFMEQKQGADESADVQIHTPPRNRSDVPSFTSPSAWNIQLDPFSPTTQRDLEDACSDDGPSTIVSLY